MIQKMLTLSLLLLSLMLSNVDSVCLPGFGARWPSGVSKKKVIDQDIIVPPAFQLRESSSKIKQLLRVVFFDDWDQDFNLITNPIKTLSQLITETEHNKIRINVKETGKSFEITADIPGVTHENVKVEISNHILQIIVEEKTVLKSESETFRRYERFHGLAKRSIRLPKDADGNKIQVFHHNGVLIIRIQKLVTSKV